LFLLSRKRSLDFNRLLDLPLNEQALVAEFALQDDRMNSYHCVVKPFLVSRRVNSLYELVLSKSLLSGVELDNWSFLLLSRVNFFQSRVILSIGNIVKDLIHFELFEF
jgi:hypothetical protein